MIDFKLLTNKGKTMTLSEIFNEKGDFNRKYFDPYRIDREDKEEMDFYNAIFDEHGSLVLSQYDLAAFINENKFGVFYDAVKLYYAQEHGSKTKRSYPATYMWR